MQLALDVFLEPSILKHRYLLLLLDIRTQPYRMKEVN